MLTYVDAGILIAAARGGSEQSARAMAILDDPQRTFVASVFVKLEVLPQARFNRRMAEVEFYEAFFAEVSAWADDLEAVTTAALLEASQHGVEAVDALHVAAASLMGAAELVTTEKPSRSIHRARSI
jgi:predicted nucleic acid-binding protein